MSAVIYIRKSPSGDGKGPGLSAEAQEAACRTEADRLGLDVTKVHVDYLSGKLPMAERPALLEAVGSLKRGDTLLVARRDRAGRDAIHVAMLEREIARRGCRLVSAAGEATEMEGPSGVFIRTVLDALSEMERGTIALRTRAALRAKRARGERAGSTPFGFELVGYSLSADGMHKHGGRLEPIPAQQETLRTMREWRESGLSFDAIARQLNEQGYDPQKGVKWWPSSVRAVLATAGKAEAKA